MNNKLKSYLLVTLMFFVTQVRSQEFEVNNELSLGLYSSWKVTAGQFIVHPELFYLPYEHWELRASLGFHSNSEKYSPVESYRSRGAFGKLGMAYTTRTQKVENPQGYRLKVGLEWMLGQVDNRTTYTFSGINYTSRDFEEERSARTVAYSFFVSYAVPLDDHWYVEISPRVYFAGLSDNDPEYSAYRFIPGAGTTRDWLDIGIHIGRTIR